MRLIDADAVAEAINDEIEITAEIGTHEASVCKGGLIMGLAYVNTAPTIDAVPQWIPCEERLPKPNVAVLGYAPAFHNIFAVCYDSVCGWMTWCPACNEPFPSCQGEIVAWMPLPEPYEGERKDDE